MAWYKAAWIPPFFAALNERFPGRNRGTDGTIGDPDHQDSPSGHNPDDTPGSKPERTDADSKPEVRAADASSSLGDPRHGMQAVVDAILRTPRDRDRLIYIIFNGSIWRAASGWRRETYTGSDKHRTHVHLSGHPDADDDGAPWTSILTLGGTGMAEDYGSMGNPDGWRTDPIRGADIWAEVRGEKAGWAAPSTNPNALGQRLTRIEAGLKEIAARVGAPAQVDVPALAAALAPLLDVDEAALVEALQSDAGQAALVRAHETAEDS
jgi:hypothetical protein